MHTLVYIDKNQYKAGIEKIVSDTSNNYKKVCYISFSDPHNIVVEMLENINVNTSKFIVIDASTNVKTVQAISKTIFLINLDSLFEVYTFLTNLIKKEGVNAIILDSISILIFKHGKLHLKEMLSKLLLGVGASGCDTFNMAYKQHMNHEIIRHLSPFIGRSLVL